MSNFSSGWDVIKWTIQGPMSKMKRALMCVIYKINHEDAKDVVSMLAIISLDLLLNIEIYIFMAILNIRRALRSPYSIF